MSACTRYHAGRGAGWGAAPNGELAAALEARAFPHALAQRVSPPAVTVQTVSCAQPTWFDNAVSDADERRMMLLTGGTATKNAHAYWDRADGPAMGWTVTFCAQKHR